MPLKRYLLYFGYIGTYFRGVQKQHCKGIPVRPAETIQGLLEICIGRSTIRPLNRPTLHPSSRTDSGVHALCSTAHTDLDYGTYQIKPEQITNNINFILTKSGLTNLRVYKTQQVPNTFSARFNAISRTYIYRLAVLKKDFDISQYSKVTSVPLPILEQDKCLFIFDSSLDVNLISKACSKYIGTKDFRSFMGSNNSPKDLNTERTILDFKIRPGHPFFPCPLTNNFDFYEIECTGKSFLYKQVRRMVGALIALGVKRISIPEIDYLLSCPSKDSWTTLIDVPSGCGLYLANIRYNESDMILTEENQIVDATQLDNEINEPIYDDDHEHKLFS